MGTYSQGDQIFRLGCVGGGGEGKRTEGRNERQKGRQLEEYGKDIFRADLQVVSVLN